MLPREVSVHALAPMVVTFLYYLLGAARSGEFSTPNSRLPRSGGEAVNSQNCASPFGKIAPRTKEMLFRKPQPQRIVLESPFCARLGWRPLSGRVGLAQTSAPGTGTICTLLPQKSITAVAGCLPLRGGSAAPGSPGSCRRCGSPNWPAALRPGGARLPSVRRDCPGAYVRRLRPAVCRFRRRELT